MSDAAAAVRALCEEAGTADGVGGAGGAAANHPANSVAPETAAVAFQFINTVTVNSTLSAFLADSNRIRLCYDSSCAL